MMGFRSDTTSGGRWRKLAVLAAVAALLLGACGGDEHKEEASEKGVENSAMDGEAGKDLAHTELHQEKDQCAGSPNPGQGPSIYPGDSGEAAGDDAKRTENNAQTMGIVGVDIRQYAAQSPHHPAQKCLSRRQVAAAVKH